MIIRRFSSLLLFSAFMACTSSSVQESEPFVPDPEALDVVLEKYIDEGFFPMAYVRLESLDGTLLYEHGTVNQDLLPGQEVTGDTWFRVWSMSKIVTISVALDLVEDGIMALDDPVTKYIPEFADLQVALSTNGESLLDFEWGNRDGVCPIQLVENDSVMTVLHCINHEAGFYYATSGFPCLDSMVASVNLPKASDSQDLINRLAQLPLVQHPGSGHFYGTNTTILGLIAERATGKTLKTLVEERITEPLQIEGLQYGLPEGVSLFPRFTGRDSILRVAERGELDIFGPDVPDYDPEHILYLGGEGMLATADGYADFVRMLLNEGSLNGHRYLDKETVAEMHAPQTQLDNPYGYNGYNLWIAGDSTRINGYGDAGLWIGGGYECTHFWVDPKRKFVGLIMSQNNEVRPPGYDLNDAFRGALYQQFWAREGETK